MRVSPSAYNQPKQFHTRTSSMHLIMKHATNKHFESKTVMKATDPLGVKKQVFTSSLDQVKALSKKMKKTP